jgi:hypothetical protein
VLVERDVASKSEKLYSNLDVLYLVLVERDVVASELEQRTEVLECILRRFS